MKVLLVNKFWYIRGGADRMVFLTKNLLEKNGHQVQIFGMRHPRNIIENEYFADYVDYDGANSLRQKLKAAGKMIYNFEAKKKFDKLVRDFQPDLIHFHNIYHQLSFSLVDVARKHKIPAVMTLHDYKLISPNYNLFHDGKICERNTRGRYYNCVLHDCLGGFWRSLLGMLEAYFVAWRGYKKMIDLYIPSSEFLKGKFIVDGFPAEKLVFIPNVLPMNQFKFNEAEGEGVLFTGRLSEEKGLKNLLSAAKFLPDVKFKIAGAGSLESELKERVRNENLVNVSLLGYKTWSELERLVESAKLIVLPSLWYENCPLSAVEAAGLGRVVLASNRGGFVEILSEAMLFDPDDIKAMAEKIKYWLELNVEKRKLARQALFNHVKNNYNADLYWSELIKAYEKAAGKKN
ncbi:MAG: glycosyltransferase [Candidatus Magasanikbacteria bacterium]|nr:glycosyltransferase [Candidatus Magasanikbacteria bacterium]